MAHLLSELLGLGLSILDGSNHVERRLGKRVMSAGENLLERTDRVLQWNESALETGKDLSDGKRLGHETLDFTGTFDLGERSVSVTSLNDEDLQ